MPHKLLLIIFTFPHHNLRTWRFPLNVLYIFISHEFAMAEMIIMIYLANDFMGNEFAYANNRYNERLWCNINFVSVLTLYYIYNTILQPTLYIEEEEFDISGYTHACWCVRVPLYYYYYYIITVLTSWTRIPRVWWCTHALAIYG